MRPSLRTVLMLGTLVVIVLMVGQAAMGIAVLRETREASSTLVRDHLPSTRLLGEILVEATRYRLRASRHAAAVAPERMEQIDHQLAEAAGRLSDRFARYALLISNQREREAWQGFLTDWEAYVLLQQRAVEASRLGDKVIAANLVEDGRDLFLATMGKLTDEIAVFEAETRIAEASVDGSYHDAVAGVAITGGIAVSIGLLLWFLSTRPAVARIEELTAVTREVAQGRLTTPVPALDRRDEIGDMARALVVCRDGLAEAEQLRRRQAELDRAHLEMVSTAKEQLALQAETLHREVSVKKAEVLAREREIVWRLSRATERRDNETGDHIVRMASIAGIIAEALGMPRDERVLIEIAAQMHDIGKVGIPDHILFKPGPLTPEERRTMETHALIGWNILNGSESRLIRMAADVAVSHHEKWDGTGYPHGLAGDAIPLCGRITALADVFDALMSRRPYKEPWSIDAARNFVIENAGKHFDPVCVAAFLSRWDEIAAIAGTSASEQGALRIAAVA